MEKQRTYTEKEVLQHIDYWRNILVESAWSSRRKNYDSHICCGQDGDDISFTKRDFEALVLELKQRFMTPQEFRKAIEDAGLVGFKFPNLNSQTLSSKNHSQQDKGLGEVEKPIVVSPNDVGKEKVDSSAIEVSTKLHNATHLPADTNIKNKGEKQ